MSEMITKRQKELIESIPTEVLLTELHNRQAATPLTFARLKRTNASRAIRWHKGDMFSWTYNDWMTALCGEVGELANWLKKLKRIEDGIPSKRHPDLTPAIIKDKIADELADIQLYLDLMATRAGLTLEHCVIKKFNRTSEEEDFPERL